MDDRTPYTIWRNNNTYHWTNIKYNPRSRSIIFWYVRRLQFWNRRAFLQSLEGKNKTNLVSASSRLFTQAKVRLSTLMRECTAIIYTLTELEFLMIGSKHLNSIYRSLKYKFPIYTIIKSKHTVYTFQLVFMKFPNLHIIWTAGKNLALPDTLSLNTQPELITRKTTVEKFSNI